jgi:hypothetical protein
MRMLLHVKFPHEPFNAAVKDGTAGKKIRRILDELKPEAVYFGEFQGRRGGIMIRQRFRRSRSHGSSRSMRIASSVL